MINYIEYSWLNHSGLAWIKNFEKAFGQREA